MVSATSMTLCYDRGSLNNDRLFNLLPMEGAQARSNGIPGVDVKSDSTKTISCVWNFSWMASRAFKLHGSLLVSTTEPRL